MTFNPMSASFFSNCSDFFHDPEPISLDSKAKAIFQESQDFLVKRPEKTFVDRTRTLFPLFYGLKKKPLKERLRNYDFYAFVSDRSKTSFEESNSGEALKEFGRANSNEENFPSGASGVVSKFDDIRSTKGQSFQMEKVPRAIRSLFKKFECLGLHTMAEGLFVVRQKPELFKKGGIYVWSNLHKNFKMEWLNDEASTISLSSTVSLYSSASKCLLGSLKENAQTKIFGVSKKTNEKNKERVFWGNENCQNCQNWPLNKRNSELLEKELEELLEKKRVKRKELEEALEKVFVEPSEGNWDMAEELFDNFSFKTGFEILKSDFE